jgi:hypothetical protein
LDARGLANLPEDAGFGRSHITITHAELAFGVKGLIAVAEKSGRAIRREEPAKDFHAASTLRL